MISRHRLVYGSLAGLLIGLAPLGPVARAQNGAPAVKAEPAATVSSRYARVVEDDEKQTLKLEMAVHSYVPQAGDGPTVYLAGAVHIADRSFYKELQAFLDAKEVVLFEGVKPPGAGRLDHELATETDEDKAAATTRRIRFLATCIEKYRLKRKAYPESLAAVVEGSGTRIGKLIEGSLKDAWGNEIAYTVKPEALEKPAPGAALPAAPPDPFELTSLGADGKPGGEGGDSDIRLSGQDPLAEGEVEEGGEGIQTLLANALGLVFQLDAMDHNKPNWRNSDLSVDQVQERLDKAGAESGQLFQMLDGSSFSAKFAGVILKIISLFPSVQAMGKMMMVDMLANADELLGAMPGGMGAMLNVIIKDRNQVVMDDLDQALKERPPHKDIAIIYGAGHLPDMEQRLTERFGYKESGVQWFAAIVVDLKKTGLTPAQVKTTREMLKNQIQRQIKIAKQQAR